MTIRGHGFDVDSLCIYDAEDVVAEGESVSGGYVVVADDIDEEDPSHRGVPWKPETHPRFCDGIGEWGYWISEKDVDDELLEEYHEKWEDEATYVPLTDFSGATRHLEEESLVVVDNDDHYVAYSDGYNVSEVQPWRVGGDAPRKYGWVFEEAPIDVEDYLINVGGVDYELKEKVEYVETLAGRKDTVEPAPERSEGEILVGFDKKDGLRDISSRNLQVLDKDGVEFKYVGWDDHGYDVYLLLDVYLDERETTEAGPRYTATD